MNKESVIVALVLTSFISMTSPVSGRLMDTIDQIGRRYQKILYLGEHVIVYEHEEYKITVEFLKDRVQKIEYRRLDGFVIVGEDRDEMFRVNSGGLAWNEIDNNAKWTAWKRLDGGMAMYTKNYYNLSFYTPEYWALLEKNLAITQLLEEFEEFKKGLNKPSKF